MGLQAVTETDLQASIVELAGLLGWLVYHTHDSRHSAAGFPDLVLVKPPRLIFAELKTEKGIASPAQLTWGAALERVDGPEVYLWRPADWRTGAVERVLRGV